MNILKYKYELVIMLLVLFVIPAITQSDMEYIKLMQVITISHVLRLSAEIKGMGK